MTTQPIDIPAFNTIQCGTEYTKQLNNTTINGATNNDNMGDSFMEDQDSMIIVPDFLQDIENNIDQIQQNFSSQLVVPEPDSEIVSEEITTSSQSVLPENNQPHIIAFQEDVSSNIEYKNTYAQTNGYSPKKKYNIIDIFTFEYEGEIKVAEDNKLIEVVKISYNQDFGNLRVTFNQVPEVAKYNNVMFTQKLKLMVAATIYPTSAFRAVNTFDGFNCTEQLINKTGEKWEKERPVVAIQQLENGEFYMWITDVTKKDTQYVYHFAGWQGMALKHCLEYCYKTGLGTRK